MINRRFVSATIGYVVVTFILAILWHLVLFKGTYDQLGYIARKEPGFVLGFLSMIFQGAVLAYLFPIISKGETTPGKGVRFALVMGIFFWSCHVLGAAAKQNISPLSTFLPMESVYLAIQFTLAGLILGLAYRGSEATHG
jgi:hypothetical protein